MDLFLRLDAKKDTIEKKEYLTKDVKVQVQDMRHEARC